MSQSQPPTPGTPTDDTARLRGLIDTWRVAVDDLLAFLETLPPDAWERPSDLPGWDLHDVAAHCSHLEHVLAGGAENLDVEIGDAPHARGALGRYTEQGVVARRLDPPEKIIAELREGADARYAALTSEAPPDASAKASPLFAGVDWNWGTLLGNRVVDIWVHEQDIRRAAGLPGGFDGAPARHTLGVMTRTLPAIVGKRAGAGPGASAVFVLSGDEVVVTVDETGRARAGGDAPAEPTVRLTTDIETFACASGGRRSPKLVPGDGPTEPGTVAVSGDEELGRRIIESLPIMP